MRKKTRNQSPVETLCQPKEDGTKRDEDDIASIFDKWDPLLFLTEKAMLACKDLCPYYLSYSKIIYNKVYQQFKSQMSVMSGQ